MSKPVSLSRDSLEVLKNFGGINQNLKVEAGKVIKTISEGQHIYAEAELDDEFPVPFCMYEIGQFLGALSLFDKPALDFGTDELKIVSEDKKNTVKFVYAAEEAIVVAPENIWSKMPKPDATFKLSEKQITQLMKAAGVMKLDNISFISEDGKLIAVVHDIKNPEANRFSVDVDVETTENFNLDTRVEYLNLLGGDYEISVCIKGKVKCSIFSHATFPVKYIIAGESTSKFG